MSVSSPRMYNSMFLGNMEFDQAKLVLQTRESKVIPNLKNMIFNFPYELILKSIEEKISIREILKRDNIDYRQYVGELRDYQTVGTAFMYLSPRSILGDGVGLGKTAEICALFNYLKQTNQMSRFIMAVENSAIGQTAAEIMRFTGLYVVQLPSEAAKLNKMLSKVDWQHVDGVIIKHSALRSDALSTWIAMNVKDDGTCKIFDTFILDESSVIKNCNTKTYTYTKNICDLCKRVHFLNATTFETNIMDIYYQSDTLDENLLPRKSRIEKEYCTFSSTMYWKKESGVAKRNFARQLSGYKNQMEFKNSLKLFYFGRCKKDVGLDRPNVYKVYKVEPTKDQVVALAKGYRYMEVLNCPSLIPEIKVGMNRREVPKLEETISLIENNFSDSNVMIYCFHKEAQQAIANELEMIGRKPVVLNGDSSSEERYEIQSKFNSGEYDVIITNIKKSLNLYGGDVCIFYSVLTVPSVMEQVGGRIDRNVDNKIKTFILLMYEHTDEEKFFMETVKQRSKDSKDLTIDFENTVDYFIESMEEDNQLTI